MNDQLSIEMCTEISQTDFITKKKTQCKKILVEDMKRDQIGENFDQRWVETVWSMVDDGNIKLSECFAAMEKL